MSAEGIKSGPDELLDIVDLDGNPTGELKGKSDIHQNGLWHRDVHVWITDGTNVLQQQRAWDKKIMPGAWDIAVGGHVGAGESYLDAAVRETEEELGLDLERTLFRPAGKLAVEMVLQPGPQQWTHRTVGDNFVVATPGLPLDRLQLQASEVVDARWYSMDQLEEDLRTPETRLRHAPQPLALWQLGIAAMRTAVEQ
jgi:isopentenyl-diphosphate Delta-isomerase